MGWDIALERDSKAVEVPGFIYGSACVVGVYVEDGLNDPAHGRVGRELRMRAGDPQTDEFARLLGEHQREGLQGPVLRVGRNEDGPLQTLLVTGCQRAKVTITYNYLRHFDFSQLKGMTGLDSIPLLNEVTATLGTERARGPFVDKTGRQTRFEAYAYWEVTPGNAGYACDLLLGWAVFHPEATWYVYN